MAKPSWDIYFMRFAYLVATRATCDRRHVGAVVVTPDRRVLATGYNGAPSKMPSCDEVGHLINNGHCYRANHAEQNCIFFAGREAKGCTIYTTTIPCADCAKAIVGVGIVKVVYDADYQSRYNASSDTPNYFRDANVECVQLDEPNIRIFKKMLSEIEIVEKQHENNNCITDNVPAPQ